MTPAGDLVKGAIEARGLQDDRALILQLTGRPRVSLSDIARAAGVSPSFVSACAHGSRRPTRRVREAAERLLGVPADQLFPERSDR